MGQLSVAEHALCPLDTRGRVGENLVHECDYRYSDTNRRVQTARVRVICPVGLLANDELFLWGLLALTLAQPEPDFELYATPHFCLRQLGLIDQHSRRGGRQYQQFAQALERLSLVSYQCDAFYDPVRREHRKVGFRFLSYSLPVNSESRRAWRFVWDPVFMDLVHPIGGHLHFDLATYRRLDPASRRLFLLLSKIFRRRPTSPRFDVGELCVKGMGFAPTVSIRDLKRKLMRSVNKLMEIGVVEDTTGTPVCEKLGVGKYVVQLHRGPYFQNSENKHHYIRTSQPAVESPLNEPLKAIGFDEAAIQRLIRKFPSRVLREWADITLAAMERKGATFFRKSPQAYFVDNVANAAVGKRRPPDWWYEALKQEQIGQQKREAQTTAKRMLDPSVYAVGGADSPDKIRNDMLANFIGAGQSAEIAQANADLFAKEFANRKDRGQ